MSTTTATPASSATEQTVPRSRVILASLIGTTIEFYDFYIYATAAVAVFPALFFTGEDANTGRIVLFMAIGMTLMGLTFGSMSAYLPELFPTNVRYTASGISYNVASILGAALTPYAAVWLNANGGVGAVGLYLAGAGLLTLIFMAITHETRDVDLTTMARTK